MAEAPRFKKVNWKALLLCLLAALVFWLFSALNKESTTDIRFPVQVLFDETRYIPTKPLPDHILVNVTGTGWDLLATETGWRHDPLRVSLDKPDHADYLLTQSLLKDLSVELGVSRLNFIHGDTLRFNFDRINTRKIRVNFNTAALAFRDGYGITGPVILQPETVDVTGPAKMLRELGNTLRLSFPERKLSRMFEDQIEIFPDQPLLSAHPEMVKVIVPVGRIRMLSFSVPVELDAPDNRWRTVEEEVKISVQVPEDKISEFDSTSVYLQLQVRKPGANRFFMHGVVEGLPAEAILLRSDSIEVYRLPK